VGSGFIVAVDDGETLFPYLVTADHVAKKLDEFGFQPFVRLNGKDGVAYERDISYLASTSRTGSIWHRHPDKSVDLAVALFGDFEEHLTFVPDSQFLKPSQLHQKGIGIGDETMTVGLFHFVRERHSNSPIVRIGNIAMLPKERLKTQHYGDMEAYLIEARSIGGLSGSPVFVRETKEFPTKIARAGIHANGFEVPYLVGGDFFLLGVIHGHWDIKLDLGINYLEAASVGNGGVNVGIAIVTPASKIADILFSTAVKSRRDDYARMKRSSTADTESPIAD
jgi:hypothetical protein